jgi:hypothetical protein
MLFDFDGHQEKIKLMASIVPAFQLRQEFVILQ